MKETFTIIRNIVYLIAGSLCCLLGSWFFIFTMMKVTASGRMLLMDFSPFILSTVMFMLGMYLSTTTTIRCMEEDDALQKAQPEQGTDD